MCVERLILVCNVLSPGVNVIPYFPLNGLSSFLVRLLLESPDRSSPEVIIGQGMKIFVRLVFGSVQTSRVRGVYNVHGRPATVFVICMSVS